MSKTRLNVKLLRYTPNPEETVAQAAKLCYSAATIDDLQEQIESLDQTAFIEKLIDTQHLSTIEHASFTFGIEGVSRALTHQLVRHRLASYSQKSQRYVKEGCFEYVVPDSIKSLKFDHLDYTPYSGDEWFADKMNNIQGWYNDLIARGVPAEDARFLLPNACETKIIVTMNARELLHFFQHRCCCLAQWEIRALATEMLKLAKAVAPAIFKNCGPGCVTDKCHEGKRSCGKAAEVKEKFLQL